MIYSVYDDINVLDVNLVNDHIIGLHFEHNKKSEFYGLQLKRSPFLMWPIWNCQGTNNTQIDTTLVLKTCNIIGHHHNIYLTTDLQTYHVNSLDFKLYNSNSWIFPSTTVPSLLSTILEKPFILMISKMKYVPILALFLSTTISALLIKELSMKFKVDIFCKRRNTLNTARGGAAWAYHHAYHQ